MRQKVFVLIALLAWSCKAERNMSELPAAKTGANDTALRVAAPPPPQAPAMPRVIIRTAEVSLVVADAAASVETLGRLAAANGGYVTDSRVWRDGQVVRATLTLRVPAPKLDAALSAVRKAATRVESETVSGDDVTQEYVDLESQVRNLEAAEAEMRQLMTTVRERTKKAEDILEVYQQLTQLRGQIETAKGRMRYLSQMSAMSTIKVSLTPDAVTKPVADTVWQPVAVMKDASRALLKTAEGVADIAIWAFVYFGPLLLILGGTLFVLWRVLRRRMATA
jgi:hypothetical protein